MSSLHRRVRRAVRDREAGASSIELVMYTPMLMLVIFVLIQFSLSWYGNEVAGAAAREAARVARISGGTPASLTAAEVRGREYASAVGGEGLQDVTVVVQRLPGDRVRATVRGRSVEIVNGLAPHVSATVEGPVEQFRPDL